MLPILRILPVGGVFIAILLLVLALRVPGDRVLPPAALTTRAHADNEDPQWRQVAIQAALRRANELMRLRDLPDTPARNELPAPPASETEPQVSEPQATTPAIDTEPSEIAGLPVERLDAEPDADSITGSIEESQGATIPVEIGAASSFELPVVLPEERPAIITPERARPMHDSRRKQLRRFARPKAAKPQPQPAPQVGFFEELFGIRQYQPPTATTVLNQMPGYRADSPY
jgi:hypothetical protein